MVVVVVFNVHKMFLAKVEITEEEKKRFLKELEEKKCTVAYGIDKKTVVG